jgi:hypothetical protein
VLAIDMLRAGYAKAFVPRAAVVHSHAYTPAQQLRRSFDERRSLREVYGSREPAAPDLLSRLSLERRAGFAPLSLDEAGRRR